MKKEIIWPKGTKEIIVALLVDKPELLNFFRKRASYYKVSIRDLIELWLVQENKCALCGDELNMNRTTHVDHIIAKNNGGKNEINNYQLVCNVCNYAKRDLGAREFILLCLKISARHQHKYLSQEEIKEIVRNSWKLQSKESTFNDLSKYIIRIKNKLGKKIKTHKAIDRNWENIKKILASAGLI